MRARRTDGAHPGGRAAGPAPDVPVGGRRGAGARHVPPPIVGPGVREAVAAAESGRSSDRDRWSRCRSATPPLATHRSPRCGPAPARRRPRCSTTCPTRGVEVLSDLQAVPAIVRAPDRHRRRSTCSHPTPASARSTWGREARVTWPRPFPSWAATCHTPSGHHRRRGHGGRARQRHRHQPPGPGQRPEPSGVLRVRRVDRARHRRLLPQRHRAAERHGRGRGRCRPRHPRLGHHHLRRHRLVGGHGARRGHRGGEGARQLLLRRVLLRLHPQRRGRPRLGDRQRTHLGHPAAQRQPRYRRRCSRGTATPPPRGPRRARRRSTPCGPWASP